MQLRKCEKGFSLVEMAIVLIIIGLILGMVFKGKDLIQSAKQKSFYNKFVKAWELSIASYYDRTGQLLGDGTINGGTAASPDFHFDNISGANFGNANGIDATLKKIGLEVPVSNTANSGQYSYNGVYSGVRTITMYLYYRYSHAEGQYHNTLYLTNIPTDLAIALDSLVDGSMDARSGNFRQYPDNTSTDGSWPDASATPVVNAMYIIQVP